MRPKRYKGLAGSPEGTATLCLPVNRILLGPFHRCNNSGKKTMGSTLHPGYRVPAPIPALALKSCGGRAGCLPSLALSFSLCSKLDHPLQPGSGVWC